MRLAQILNKCGRDWARWLSAPSECRKEYATHRHSKERLEALAMETKAQCGVDCREKENYLNAIVRKSTKRGSRVTPVVK
mmetsp:Transcript_17963/g.43172  ORF Transcript_17963/g.43172 Transcript_17963/m.43172 type:complete len:80 (-) Transcript_17963:60-299(-)